MKCIICNNQVELDGENICMRCINDMSKIDAVTLPEWLLKIEARRSVDFLLSLKGGERE
jgi:hypothetical protein